MYKEFPDQDVRDLTAWERRTNNATAEGDSSDGEVNIWVLF